MALALAADDRLAVHVFHDERAAAFAALGHGLATGQPAIALCTSGTAATHFHAAVVEADLSSVPLIACTADRPPELWDIGAPQTIDQTHLYGSSVRFFAQPGVPDAAGAPRWRPLGARTVAEAAGWSDRPGPVQLNLSFRDPLVGQPGELPPGRPGGRPWHHRPVDQAARSLPPAAAAELAATVRDGSRIRSGVIIAGRATSDPDSVLALAGRLGWPVLADHRSGCRTGSRSIQHFDGLLRSSAFAERAMPEVILRFGEALSSKVLSGWIATSSAAGATVISVVDRSRWIDPESVADHVVAAPGAAAAILDAVASPTSGSGQLEPSTTAQQWEAADRLAAAAVEAVLAGIEGPNEIHVTRQVVAGLPAGGALVVASSMPVRDVEWFGPSRASIDVFANRGANGIDGVLSTAIGVALTGRSTTVLLGDVALLHDSSALTGLRHRPVRLDVVVIDNDGGGIFSFLPQASLLEAATFEQLFGTPHGTDLIALCQAHGLDAGRWPLEDGGTDGVRVAVATTDRAANVALHDHLNRAIVKAVES
jgi:2-succinyl-5-enolpyruvyl-6-hydroxy-3-cyclohexene-1-carboxylate synthase